MKNNKLFGGLGPEKAGELGGNAHHKCRGRECDAATHAGHSKEHHNENKSTTTHKAATEHQTNKNKHTLEQADKSKGHKKN